MSRAKDEVFEEVSLGTDLDFWDYLLNMDSFRDIETSFDEFSFWSSSVVFLGWLEFSAASGEASDGWRAFSGSFGAIFCS